MLETHCSGSMCVSGFLSELGSGSGALHLSLHGTHSIRMQVCAGQLTVTVTSQLPLPAS